MSSCWEDGLRWRRSDRPRRAAAATTTACDWPLCAAAAPSPHPLPRRRREAAQRGQAARARPAARAAVRHSRSNGGSPALGGHRRDASLLCSRNVMRGTEEGARPAHCSPASLAPHRTSPSRGRRLPCPGTATGTRPASRPAAAASRPVEQAKAARARTEPSSLKLAAETWTWRPSLARSTGAATST
jgi:hypothetical protein